MKNRISGFQNTVLIRSSISLFFPPFFCHVFLLSLFLFSRNFSAMYYFSLSLSLLFYYFKQLMHLFVLSICYEFYGSFHFKLLILLLFSICIIISFNSFCIFCIFFQLLVTFYCAHKHISILHLLKLYCARKRASFLPQSWNLHKQFLFIKGREEKLEWLLMEWWCRVNYVNDGANDFKNVLVEWIVDEWNDVVCEVIKEVFCSFANPLSN